MKPLFALIFAAALFTESTHALTVRPVPAHKINSTNDERNVKDFKGVVAGGPIEVVITLGDKEGLRFEGDAEAISTLVSEVKGSVLIIRPQNSWTSWAKKYENKKIVAHVTAKTITSLTMSGNGSITVSGTINAAELTTTLSGSGTIKAKVDVDKITGVLSGSGAIDVNGKSGTADVTLSGKGSFGGKSFAADNLSTRISGSGSIYLNTDGNIKALISGSGHVYYSGNPNVEKRVLGAGGVEEM